MTNDKLKARRLDLERKYLNKFCSKHSYGRFEFCSGERYCWDFANFDIYQIFYDIDNNCKSDEIFKWFYWSYENDSKINFDTWIKFGGSANADKMLEMFADNQKKDLEISRKKCLETKEYLLDCIEEHNGKENY